jgi:hypothetical protein
VIAAPAVGRRGRVAGRGREAAYLDADGFIVVLSVEPPVLPNGAQVRRLPNVGDVFVVPGGEVWDPTLRLRADPAVRGEEIRRALDAGAFEGACELEDAVRRRDPELARAAAARLIGRGTGLTPEGDDLVAGTAAVVAAGPWPAARTDAWLRALLGDDLRTRTTALSATLLELAAAGQIARPVHDLFGPDWRDALARLRRLGHSTGAAYARAAGGAVRLL